LLILPALQLQVITPCNGTTARTPAGAKNIFSKSLLLLKWSLQHSPRLFELNNVSISAIKKQQRCNGVVQRLLIEIFKNADHFQVIV
jgi:hypothetical protein